MKWSKKMILYKFARAVLSLFFYIFYRVEVVGNENIPDEGRFILIANHKHNYDPLLLISAIKNRRIYPVAKKELFDIPIIGWLLRKVEVIPIDRQNPSLTTVKKILNTLKEEKILGIFPEGTRSDLNSFLPAKPGVAMFSIKSKTDVIPISIISTYKPFSKIKIVIGNVMDMSKYYNKKISKDRYPEIAEEMMNEVILNYNKNKF